MQLKVLSEENRQSFPLALREVRIKSTFGKILPYSHDYCCLMKWIENNYFDMSLTQSDITDINIVKNFIGNIIKLLELFNSGRRFGEFMTREITVYMK